VGRVVAIDYGRKRVGIAASDPDKLIANGLRTVGAHEVLSFLQAYTGSEAVDCFVVGHPKQLNNTDSESMAYIKPFVTALGRKFPDIPIKMYDERFTSVLAHRALIEGGAKKKTRQNKGLIDTISATIILTSYLESIRNTPNP
jgi:putative Holliday junction resolvase